MTVNFSRLFNVPGGVSHCQQQPETPSLQSSTGADPSMALRGLAEESWKPSPGTISPEAMKALKQKRRRGFVGPRAPLVSRHDEGDPGMKAVKRARRQGFVGPKGPVQSGDSALVRRALSPLAVNQPATASIKPAPPIALLMIEGAIKGMDKMRSLSWLKRDHLMKMLEANDLPGLEAATSELGNPFRSYATGLKVGKQLLDQFGAEQFSPSLYKALADLKTFYEEHSELVELGDPRAYSPYKARSKTVVDNIRAALDRGDELLSALEDALAGEPGKDEQPWKIG